MLERALLKQGGPQPCALAPPNARRRGPLADCPGLCSIWGPAAEGCASLDALHWAQTTHDSRQVKVLLQASRRTSRKSYLGLCSSLKPAARWCDSQGLLSL